MNGGMSRREREREQEEREIPMEVFTDSITGEQVIIADTYRNDSELIDRLTKAGINYETAIRSDLINPNIEHQKSNLIEPGYRFRMLTGNSQFLSTKINKIEGEQALKQVMIKSKLYSGMATIIPGIGTSAGFLIGNAVAISEIFLSNLNAKTVKSILNDFITSLFSNLTIIETSQGKKTRTVNSLLYESDVNEIIQIIQKTFKGTPLQNACDSLQLSDIPFFPSDIKNVVQFKVSIKKKRIIDIKKIGLIGAGLLALRFLIFKG